jgi:hypothetical protein
VFPENFLLNCGCDLTRKAAPCEFAGCVVKKIVTEKIPKKTAQEKFKICCFMSFSF